MNTIRLLHEKDVEAYQALRLRSFSEAPFAFSESYEDEVKKGKEAFLLELKQEGNPVEQFILAAYNDDSTLIGFVKFRRDKRSKARHKSMIHAMYIRKDYRNQNIGRDLISNLIERVKQLKGLEQIHLWVLHSSNSSSAADFYKRCGFISQGAIVKNDLKVDNQYINAEYMVMYLTKD